MRALINNEKIENNAERLLMMQDRIRNLNRQKDYEREKTLEEIMQRRKDIEFRLEQHNSNLEKQRDLKDKMRKRKEEYDNNFQKMFHSGNIDKGMIEQIHQMFPENEKINCLLNRLEELKEQDDDEGKNVHPAQSGTRRVPSDRA